MLLELRNHWDVETPLGCGRAIIIENADQDYLWTIILESGALVTFPQNKIHISRHYTYGINFADEDMMACLGKWDEIRRR